MAFDPNALFKIEDITSQFDPEDMKQNQGEAIATAIPILCWLPAATKHSSPYLSWLANQTLAVLLFGVVAGVLGTILSIIPILGVILRVVLYLCTVALSLSNFVLAIIGKAIKLPIVGALNLEVFK